MKKALLKYEVDGIKYSVPLESRMKIDLDEGKFLKSIHNESSAIKVKLDKQFEQLEIEVIIT